MTAFLTALEDHAVGVSMLIGLVAAGAALAVLVCWLAQVGRFKGAPPESRAGVVIAKLFRKVIDDFRHLLALVVFLLFALVLGLAILPGLLHSNVAEIGEGVESVAAALGGLIGSIIGYYFGESMATTATAQRALPGGGTLTVQAARASPAASGAAGTPSPATARGPASHSTDDDGDPRDPAGAVG